MVKELIQEIKKELTQTSSSGKDEVKVMKAMLNDKEYSVGVYDNTGKVGEYCPREDAEALVSSVISSAAKISKDEADKLADNFEFKKADAQQFVNISKEFVNTYLQTGRKLPLGIRETSNVALSLKHEKETEKPCPRKIGVDENGKGIYKSEKTKINAHDTIKVHSSCPQHLK